ncbi:MAG: ribosome silencing factor [Planctomycetaceae bacterium]|nr:ribosome silencing factor [Planctomycetaceae bacterium]
MDETADGHSPESVVDFDKPEDETIEEVEDSEVAVSEEPAAVGDDTVTRHAERSPELYQRSLANAVTAARCADEMRAKNIVVLDMTKIASIVDFFVIATGTSRRQMHAIADEVNRKLKGEQRNTRLSIEGYRTESNWILMDFGDVVLHVFTEEGRQLYDLENLKADATRIDWQQVSVD